MWQRFTERARKAVFYGQEEAQRFGYDYVDSECLLLGLLREPDSPASQVLTQLGINLDLLRNAVEKLLVQGDAKPSQDMTLTPRCKRVIDYAYDEARSLNNNYIGTEHLLLGLIREDGGTNREVFSRFHLDLEGVRRAVLLLQDGEPIPVLPEPLRDEVEKGGSEEPKRTSLWQKLTGRAKKVSARDKELTPQPSLVKEERRAPSAQWQRFSERARKVVFFAQEEAQQYGEDYVSTEHLLLGLIREPDTVAGRVLEALDVNLNDIRADIESRVSRGESHSKGDITLTPRSTRVIDLAYDEARNLNNNYIGTEHLLLGLARESDGLAGKVLARRGPGLEEIRRMVMWFQDGAVGQPPTASRIEIGNRKPNLLGGMNRFTEQAKSVMSRAQEEAQHWGEGYVATEHILLGLIREPETVACRALGELGVTLDQVRAEVESRLPKGEPREDEDVTLTPRSKRVIDLAYDEARNLNNSYIGTEHLLLGIVREGDGNAGRALAKLGIDLESARLVVMELQDEVVVDAPPDTEGWNEQGEPLPELFSDRARSAVNQAHTEALHLGKLWISAEHLLLGLIHDHDSVAVKVLERLGVSLNRVTAEIQRQLVNGAPLTKGDTHFTRRANRVIQFAHREAERLGDLYVGTEHLLLGLIFEEEGIAGRTLQKLGANLEKAREVVSSLQDRSAQEGIPYDEIEEAVEQLNPLPTWQRFNERAQNAMRFALEEAQETGEGYVSTEHLLLGVIRESDNCAARVLERLGVSRDRIGEEIKRQRPRGEARPGQDPMLTPRSKRVIDLAYDEARNLKDDYVGTEHLLLALIREEDGLAGRVLANVGLELEATWATVAQMHMEESEPDEKPSGMWDRFTERAKRVIFFAQDEARALGESNVSTEHILLGLVREPDGTAGRVFEKLGIGLNRIRAEVERQVHKGDPITNQEMTLTPRGKRVIDLTYYEAQYLGDNHIGTEHLLLGLLREGDGLAGRVLVKLGLDLETVRQTAGLVRELERDHADEAPIKLIALHAWERYSEHAKTAIFYALEQAKGWGESDQVESEHILLGITQDPSFTSVRVLNLLGIDSASMRAKVVVQPPQADQPLSEEVWLTPRSKQVADYAYDEALTVLNDDYIGTEHLLLGLVREGTGLAGEMLTEQGVELTKLREIVRRVQESDVAQELAESGNLHFVVVHEMRDAVAAIRESLLASGNPHPQPPLS